MTEITVQYERKFSDGNFGSEGLSLGMTFTRESDSFDPEELVRAATALRKAVLEQLSRSRGAPRVASAASHELNPPPPRVPVPAGASDLEDQPF